MKVVQESIISSVFRSFFTAFFAIVGVGVAIILVSVAVSFVFKSSPQEMTAKVQESILPNANGTRELQASHAPILLTIPIHGPIGTDTLNAAVIEEQLLASREAPYTDGRVKGILLDINSPGGLAGSSANIYYLIKEYKERYNIPVYAYVRGICASGALYIAAAADKIYASPDSVIGSVGVIANFFNVSSLLDKVGVKSLTLSVGKNKDLMNPFRPWTDDDDNELTEVANNYYALFVDAVASGRPDLDKQALTEEYGAAVFPAPTAKKNGYIDEIVDYPSSALQALVDVTDLTDTPYQVVSLKGKHWWPDILNSKSPLVTGTIEHNVKLPIECSTEFANRFLFLYTPKTTP